MAPISTHRNDPPGEVDSRLVIVSRDFYMRKIMGYIKSMDKGICAEHCCMTWFGNQRGSSSPAYPRAAMIGFSARQGCATTV